MIGRFYSIGLKALYYIAQGNALGISGPSPVALQGQKCIDYNAQDYILLPLQGA